MSIYEPEGQPGFVISSKGSWLPGSHATKAAARWAYQFPNTTLQRLRDRVNVGEGRDITTDDLRAVRDQAGEPS